MKTIVRPFIVESDGGLRSAHFLEDGWRFSPDGLRAMDSEDLLIHHELEAADPPPANAPLPFRPMFLPQPRQKAARKRGDHTMSQWVFVLLGLLVFVGWVLGSIYYLTIGRIHQ